MEPARNASPGGGSSEALKDLERTAKKLKALLGVRNKLILKAREEGASLREIGNHLDINHVTVRNILSNLDELNNLVILTTEENRQVGQVGDDTEQ